VFMRRVIGKGEVSPNLSDTSCSVTLFLIGESGGAKGEMPPPRLVFLKKKGQGKRKNSGKKTILKLPSMKDKNASADPILRGKKTREKRKKGFQKGHVKPEAAIKEETIVPHTGGWKENGLRDSSTGRAN